MTNASIEHQNLMARKGCVKFLNVSKMLITTFIVCPKLVHRCVDEDKDLRASQKGNFWDKSDKNIMEMLYKIINKMNNIFNFQ